MGTNFYIRTDDDRSNEGQMEHIGKRSAGWVFSFQGRNFRSVSAWMLRLMNLGVQETIVDEYGREFAPLDFIVIVQGTKEPWGPKGIVPKSHCEHYGSGPDKNWDDQGYSFSAYEFS